MSRFTACLPFILAKEGGKVDDPTDRGGRTAYGVTQRAFDDYLTTRALPHRDVWTIQPDEVASVYYSDYWQKCPAGIVDKPLDLVMMDSAVQHGPGRATKWMQTVIGATVDGAYGPASQAAYAKALSAQGVMTLCDKIITLRTQFYAAIIARDLSQMKYKNGWSNRIKSLQKEIAK